MREKIEALIETLAERAKEQADSVREYDTGARDNLATLAGSLNSTVVALSVLDGIEANAEYRRLHRNDHSDTLEQKVDEIKKELVN